MLGGLLAINCFSDALLESEIRDSMTSDTKMKNAEENQRLKYLRFFAFVNNLGRDVVTCVNCVIFSLVTLTGQNAVLGLSMRYARTR